MYNELAHPVYMLHMSWFVSLSLDHQYSTDHHSAFHTS